MNSGSISIMTLSRKWSICMISSLCLDDSIDKAFILLFISWKTPNKKDKNRIRKKNNSSKFLTRKTVLR